MSVNCIRCVTNKRTGSDLLCDSCRQRWGWNTFDPAPHGQDAYIVPAEAYSHAVRCVNGCATINPEAVAELFEACIQARGALTLDHMLDDDGKPFGTTQVALEALNAAILKASK